jgi:peptide/nickel transport system substrate-binding protein
VAATWIIGLNTRLPPFNDIRIRQAFKAAVDSEAFRKEFYPDANPAVGYIPRGLPGHLTEDPKPHASTKPATKKPIVVAFPEVLAREKEMRVFLEKSLQAQGWNVSFVPMSWEKLMEGYDKKTLPAFLVAMNMDYPDTEFLIRNFESGNPDNFSGISNPKLDARIREARSTQDRIGRSGLYQTIARRLEDLAVTINLFYPRSHNWISPCVKNFVPNIMADYYIDYRTVEVDPSCAPKAGGRT